MFGAVSTSNERGVIQATHNYWNTVYAPLHSSDVTSGCPDGDGTSTDGSINLTASPWYRAENLIDQSGNCKPLLVDIPDQTGNIGFLLEVTANCADPNLADSLVFTDDTALFTIDAGTGLISFTPGSSINEDITITCSDTEFVDSDLFNILVLPGSGFIPSYSSGAIANVVIDNLVGIGVGIFALISLVALVILYRWLSGYLVIKD